jgi:hypothetical protein
MFPISFRVARASLIVSALLAGCAAAPAPEPVSAVPPAKAFDCRDVEAQVLLDGTVAHLPTRACRDGSGQWQLVQDDSSAGYPAGTFLVYDPTVWGYPFFGFGADVVIVDHSHFHHDHFFHGSFMRRRH